MVEFPAVNRRVLSSNLSGAAKSMGMKKERLVLKGTVIPIPNRVTEEGRGSDFFYLTFEYYFRILFQKETIW